MIGARYAPVGPIAVLEHLQEAGLLGTYCLFIGQDVLEHPLEYAHLVHQMVMKAAPTRDPITIFIDNGVIEHGEPLSVAKILEAHQLISGSIVALPDVIGDREATVGLATQAYREINGAAQVMMIPQGKDNADLVRCVDELRALEPLAKGTVWGIPRWIANEQGSRMPIVQYINQRCTDPKIHLLGTSKNISDDLRATRLPGVTGIDSANPIVMGLEGKQLGYDKWEHLPRGTYWNATFLTDDALHNVEYMRNAIG